MSEPQPPPAADTPEEAPERKAAQIARINELSQLARTAWFSLLGYLVFVGITLLGVKDADFFVSSRQTDLPLIGVQIPTASFFWTAPVLGAALYTYLHLFLIKLWDTHGEARTSDADGTHHWLVGDFVLIWQGDRIARARPLAFLTDWVTRLLVWVAGPFVLAYAWWRSMPAHDEWLTLLIAACLWLTLLVGFTSWIRAEENLRRREPWHWSVRHTAGILVAAFLISVSWLRTEGGFDETTDGLTNFYEELTGTNLFAAGQYGNGDDKPARIVQEEWVTARFLTFDDLTLTHRTPIVGRWIDQFRSWNPLAETDLTSGNLVSLPQTWRPPESTRAAFRKMWCEREGLDVGVCGPRSSPDAPTPVWVTFNRASWCGNHGGLSREACSARFEELEARFTAAWAEERKSARSAIETLDLSGRDLRNAYAFKATLVQANLGRARMQGAILPWARLEGANLNEARMTGANLEGAYLEEATLWGTRLDGALLEGARMRGAVL